MAAQETPRVLLVEDDAAVRRPLQKFLEMHKFEVTTAVTADQALDAIQQFKPTAAIIDLRLARGSGSDVVASMPPETPIIIFSGVPSESAELEHTRPCTRLITKPFSLVMLIEMLEEMVKESSAPTPIARAQSPGPPLHSARRASD